MPRQEFHRPPQPGGHSPDPAEFGFVAVRGWLDCRQVQRDGRPGVEFTWEGVDEGDQVTGRGWAILVDDQTIEGHLFFHLGDDSTFRAEPFAPAD
jgi:hypothetical protein